MSNTPLKLDDAKQGRHVPGHANFKHGRSILWADVADLFPFLGSGQAVRGVAGQPGYRERIDFGRTIGLCVDDKSIVVTPTSKGIVHYGKRGFHIVPCRP